MIATRINSSLRAGVLLMGLVAAPCFAQNGFEPMRILPSRPAAAIATSQVKSLAYVASGGGWETTVVLINLGSTGLSFRQIFFGNEGAAATFPVRYQGSSQTIEATAAEGTLGPNATMSFTLVNSGASLQEGWSLLSFQGVPNQLSAYAIIRHQETTPGFLSEATIPFSAMQDFSARMPFDNSGDLATQITILNPASNLAAQVRLTYYSSDGQTLLLDVVTVKPGEQTTFTLANTYPDLAGKTGTVAILSNTNCLSVTGLRMSRSSGEISALPVADFIQGINLQ